ncbi:hypothetical protein GLOTRDRAFT_128933 [Gloeophyllum trabeum ATCC 11539]|uniref:Uncharacterized protein n=1 Tax=Gloeophyllum trabeum (strain ATCC 11539 / FP-39264 / Madison 617) TaxID=670483 RepID=S7Q862_GLOTA|nr:uncharacterized protein GLOTRDRAFT_128933 [Gloeophyllum trabeum ATCC 11539]EPQ55717.1 hypothetical protein GLOTRDRAFT_128933 [Gloeophyllum trabeum ATCC 11539]
MELPHELWYEILQRVLADSIHSVSTLAEEATPQWDMDVVGILSSVSGMFRAIAIDLSVKVLAVSPYSDPDLNPAEAARHAMQYLRCLAKQTSDVGEEETRVWSRMPAMTTSPLLQGYTLYLNAVALRRKYRYSQRKQPREGGPSAYCNSSPSQRADVDDLVIALEKSRLVAPNAMAGLLDEVVREEIKRINMEVD